MTLELKLQFPDPNHLKISLGEVESRTLDFVSPIKDEELRDVAWYLETYAARYTTDVDDERADDIRDRLPGIGSRLHRTVFADGTAGGLLVRFLDSRDHGRVLTISSEHPAILSLPWELLCEPDGTFMFLELPRISIRRKVPAAAGWRGPFKVQAKDRLRLLFVVSRPTDESFIDPRSDPQAVLDAVEKRAKGRVEVEFLRPPTLRNLDARLENESLPPVDILHFDGHGVFDPTGALARDKRKTAEPEPALVGAMRKEHAAEAAVNVGYLAFEKKDGKRDLVAAKMLGDLLHRKQVSLVVLSACQSAAVGGEDPMGGVAARLTKTGIPAVVAMSYSVLVPTTRILFGEFYRHLSEGKGIGASLDTARRELYRNRDRHEVQRGPKRVKLKLCDWFVPALYQSGEDVPLLTEQREGEAPEAVAAGRSNIRELQEAGFFGRRRELWEIEKWFVAGTRRITITGFGGMGKTFLAEEAGRWLQRTRMFNDVVFVDYASFQGIDALGYALSVISTVLERSLVSPDAATAEFGRRRVLLILDNLEALDEAPLQELLTAAKAWSEGGESRLLLTTRTPEPGHPDYPTAMSNRHRVLSLRGLDPEEALLYFEKLMTFDPPPTVPKPDREGLLNIFASVDFQPLSINLLANELRTCRLADVGQRLEKHLAENPESPLTASLNLSLDRVDPKVRKWLPRLGVFEGGAMEHMLLEVTEIPKADWESLRTTLVSAALIQPETIPGVTVPYLKFHPTLAPLMWSRLSPDEQDELVKRHRDRYYALSAYLHDSDAKTPREARAVVRRELANLLKAVHRAIDATDESCSELAGNVSRFLTVFGLMKECGALTEAVAQISWQQGSRPWYLALLAHAEHLSNSGRSSDAKAVLVKMLRVLGKAQSYNRCSVLFWLARCVLREGRPHQAIGILRQTGAEAAKLDQSVFLKRARSHILTELAEALIATGQYEDAKAAISDSKLIAEELGDHRQVAVAASQLGQLALSQGWLRNAAEHYIEAHEAFKALGEPAMEAVAWHQLGMVYQRAMQYKQAENAYREAARIKERLGMIVGPNDIVTTWGQLAQVCALNAKLGDAEKWHRKAIKTRRESGDKVGLSTSLNNLGNLLQALPGRLEEARQLAEESLSIKKSLESGTSMVWTTLGILGEIAEKQDDDKRARRYRRLAYEAYAAFPGSKYELVKHVPLILAAVAAAQGNSKARKDTKEIQAARRQAGGEWERFADCLDRVLAGDRDESMVEDLDYLQALILMTIIRAIEDTSTLEPLLALAEQQGILRQDSDEASKGKE